MPWVIQNPLQYLSQLPRGTGENHEQCATLAQVLVAEQRRSPPMPLVKDWMPGVRVKGSPLSPGTVIAIFDRNGVYSGQSGKAHTALYVRQSSEGIEVVHQYKRCGTIKGTLIRFGGGKLAEFSTDDFKVQVAHSTVPSLRFPDQRFPDHRSGVSRKNVQGFPVVTPEDDADNYYVVEQRATRNVNQNPEDFVVHISRSTAPNL